MRKRNNNPLDKSYLIQPGPDLEINSYLIPIYRNYFIRTGEISSNKEYKLINEELNFNHNRIQFNIDSKIKRNSEICLSSSCIPDYIFNKQSIITISSNQFSYNYSTASVTINFGNFKFFINPNTFIKILFNGEFPIPPPPIPPPEPITRVITLPFKLFVDTFVFDSDIYIKKGSVIRLPSEECANFLNLSNPGENPKVITPFRLSLPLFSTLDHMEWNSENVITYSVNLWKGVSIIKSIKNESFLPIQLKGYYGDVNFTDEEILNYHVLFLKGSKIHFNNQPIPPGPINPEVINISLDFENPSYSPENDFNISKDSLIQIDPNLLTNIEIVKPDTSSESFSLPSIVNLNQASSFDPDEDDPNLIYYHFPQINRTEKPYYFYPRSNLSFIRNITASKFELILDEQNPEWICDGIIPAIGSKIKFRSPPVPFPEVLQHDLDFLNPSLIWTEDKAIAQNSYVRISPEIINDLRIVDIQNPLILALPILNINEFEYDPDYEIPVYIKTAIFKLNRNTFINKDSSIQIPIQIPAVPYNIVLTRTNPEFTFLRDFLVSPNSKVKAIYEDPPPPVVFEELKIKLSPFRTDNYNTYHFFNDTGVMEGSYVEIDPELCFDRYISDNSPFELLVDIDTRSFKRFKQVGQDQFMFQVLIDRLPLTLENQKLCLGNNVTLTNIISFTCETIHYILDQNHPQFVFEDQHIYSPSSTISISSDLIPDEIFTEDQNENPKEVYIMTNPKEVKGVVTYDLDFTESILFRKGSKLRLKITI